MRNAGNQHFLLVLQCFQSIPKEFLFLNNIHLSSADAVNLDQSKNLSFGKRLKVILGLLFSI